MFNWVKVWGLEGPPELVFYTKTLAIHRIMFNWVKVWGLEGPPELVFYTKTLAHSKVRHAVDDYQNWIIVQGEPSLDE
ncbi:hypothetical protein QE152_g19132 [Popillia japonica]|uniref:Uncharacterized protein n=1 Tax=Popillia japonica TaxID=7064 RepID=A0AAW1L2T9_POPJA